MQMSQTSNKLMSSAWSMLLQFLMQKLQTLLEVCFHFSFSAALQTLSLQLIKFHCWSIKYLMAPLLVHSFLSVSWRGKLVCQSYTNENEF